MKVSPNCIIATISISLALLALWQVFNLKNQLIKSTNAALSATIHQRYTGGGEGEWGERLIARMYTKPSASVLEFGGGAGSVSVTVSQILDDPENHVVIQPEHRKAMMGGVARLQKNKAACNAPFVIIDRYLKPGDGKTLPTLIPKGEFDTIIADCEGCLHKEYDKNPSLFDSVTQIQVERDDKYNEYDDFLINVLEMHKIEPGIGLGCEGRCNTEVWASSEQAH